MKNKKALIKIVIILLLGGLASVLVLTALNSSTVKVIVASKDIMPGDTFSSDNLTTVDMPKNVVIDGVTVLKASDIVGKTCNGYLSPNEMVSYSRISEDKADSYLANMDDKEKNYGVQVTIDADNPLTGISIGDYVSLISTIKGVNGDTSATAPIGDKYKVIGVSINSDSGAISSIEIEVTPENLSKVSHVILNEKVLVSVVDKNNNDEDAKGITQESLYNEASN